MDTPNQPNRLTLARYARSIAMGRGNLMSAQGFADANYGPQSIVARMVRAAVLGTSDLATDADFVAASTSFLGSVRERGLIPRIGAVSPWRSTLPATRMLVQNAATVAQWRGEGMPLAITAAGFDSIVLPVLSFGCVVVETIETVRATGGQSDEVLNNDLVGAAATLEAASMFDPALAGVTGVSPPSLTHDAPSITSSGSDAASIIADMGALFDVFEGDWSTAVIVANPATAGRLSLMGASVGALSLASGGSYWCGLPFFASTGVPPDVIALVDPSNVLLVPPVLIVDSSETATVEISDEGGETSLLSLWQNDLLALRLVEMTNWRTARDGVVVCLKGLSFAPTPPATVTSKIRKAAAA
jgi:hypothetical protein